MKLFWETKNFHHNDRQYASKLKGIGYIKREKLKIDNNKLDISWNSSSSYQVVSSTT
jgi:hypothetical protein